MRGWLRLAAVLAAALLCCGMAGCAPQATGAFYTLEEAYEAGFLTREDLMSIAYYFTDANYFRRMFKRHTGVSLREYKKNNGR